MQARTHAPLQEAHALTQKLMRDLMLLVDLLQVRKSLYGDYRNIANLNTYTVHPPFFLYTWRAQLPTHFIMSAMRRCLDGVHANGEIGTRLSHGLPEDG
eukprot:4504782-Pleurochrysis_carterae.AAC.1